MAAEGITEADVMKWNPPNEKVSVLTRIAAGYPPCGCLHVTARYRQGFGDTEMTARLKFDAVYRKRGERMKEGGGGCAGGRHNDTMAYILT